MNRVFDRVTTTTVKMVCNFQRYHNLSQLEIVKSDSSRPYRYPFKSLSLLRFDFDRTEVVGFSSGVHNFSKTSLTLVYIVIALIAQNFKVKRAVNLHSILTYYGIPQLSNAFRHSKKFMEVYFVMMNHQEFFQIF